MAEARGEGRGAREAAPVALPDMVQPHAAGERVSSPGFATGFPCLRTPVQETVLPVTRCACREAAS